MIIDLEDRIITREFVLDYRYSSDEGAGFSFPCNEQGVVDTNGLCPEAITNLKACQAGEVCGEKVYLKRIAKLDSVEYKCSCGSGKPRYALDDARGIFCCYVCEDCEQEARSRYRVDVMEDSNYEADEPIEPEEY